MRHRKPEPKSHFAGIDLSLLRPGICTGSSIGDFRCSSVKMPDGKKFQHPTLRYKAISNLVMTFVKRESIVIMEDYAYGASGKTFAIAENGGILKYRMICEYGIPHENIHLVSTHHLKMFATGKGNSTKDIILKEVFRRYGFDTSSNDEADAYILWRIGLALHGKDPDVTKYQKDILKKIREYNGKNS